MLIALGFISVLALMLARVPIGIALGLVGTLGFAAYIGMMPALRSLGSIASDTVLNYDYAVIPMFILMGNLISRSGISDDLFRASYAWLGSMRGGLGLATIASCGGFSAVSGSSVATAATMVRVAVPSMRRYNYSESLAAGSVAAGGTLGILIPPSIVLILYGIMTETDIGKLFAAGIVPGLLGILLYMAAIWIWAWFRPEVGPAAAPVGLREKLNASRGIVGMLGLFILVIGGIYVGLFTPTEAAGVGAFGALVIALLRRRLTLTGLIDTVYESAVTTVALLTILIGALVFANFMNVARLPQTLGGFVQEIGLTPFMVILAIVVVYLLLGCFLESMSMLLLTVPIFYPIVAGLGFDLIWFGILVVVVIEIAMITPPIGMNIFVIRGVLGDIPIATIYRGVIPFVMADLVRVALLMAVPALALWLPNSM
jgi:tripartite ATP-independent transporter DctM subunit